MYSNRYRSPIIACAVLGVACVTYIAYFFYKKNKKKASSTDIRVLSANETEIYARDGLLDDFPEVNPFSEFLVVQPTDSISKSATSSFYDDDLEYIEDLSVDGYNRNRRYKIFGSPSNKEPNPVLSSLSGKKVRSRTLSMNSKANELKKLTDEKSEHDEWTVLDNYSNIDGTCEEYTFVEKTNNKFSEEVDLQENQPLPLNTSSCCDSCNCNNNCDDTEYIDSGNSDLSLNDSLTIANSNKHKTLDTEFETPVRESVCSFERYKNGEGVGFIDPSTVKIYLKNFGCSHNISDSEYMLGLIVDHGYSITDSIEDCDVMIVNSCTVKNPSEDGMVSYIKLGLKLDKYIIVSGCIPQSNKNHPIFNNNKISLVGIMQIDQIVYVIENVLGGNKVVLLEKKELPSLDLPKVRRNKYIEIIPISTGCLGSCTFCKTKQSRGTITSYTVEVILDRIESCIASGVREIWLTSEDLGAYGIDLNINIITLLNSILTILPPKVMIRLGMCNPPYIKKYINEICDVLLHENVYEFLHIPVQSCSDAVLDRMNREYTLEDFLYIIKVVKEKVPNCTIATDIISGFPTETQDDHEMTMKVLGDLKLSVINISQYYARKGTVSSYMKELPNNVKKNRSRDITNLFMSYNNNEGLVGRTFTVFFNHTAEKRDKTQLTGYTKSYVKVIVKGIEEVERYYGTSHEVRVVKAHKWHLEGVLM